MSKKKKMKTRAEPKSEPKKVSWLCSDEAFETLTCRGYTSLSQNPEIVTAVEYDCQAIREHDNPSHGEFRRWRRSGKK